MKAPYFVEVLSRHKEVRHRYRVEQLPINIGRDYDNDIILDDQHIASRHAVVEEDQDGCLRMRDLDSCNGILYKGKRKKELPIDAETIFRLGHTYLRIRSADYHVDQEVPVSVFYKWEGWTPALTGLALVLLYSVFAQWIDDFKQFEVSDYIAVSVIMMSFVFICSGIWAFTSRLFGEYARLGRHVFIFGCALIIGTLCSYLCDVIAYSLSLEKFTRYGSHVWIAIFVVMVFFHLQQIRPNLTKRFALSSVVLFVFLSGGMLLFNYNERRSLSDELFMYVRFPPSLRLAKDKSVSVLMSDVTQLKSSVDNERNKAEKDEE